MGENERTRILNMLKEGKITVEDAEKLLSALNIGSEEEKVTPETVALKDNRGRKPKRLRISVDAGDGGDKAKVNVNLPVSLIKTLGPIAVNNMPREAKEELDRQGIDITSILADIDSLLSSGMDEDIVNIDIIGLLIIYPKTLGVRIQSRLKTAR